MTNVDIRKDLPSLSMVVVQPLDVSDEGLVVLPREDGRRGEVKGKMKERKEELRGGMVSKRE